MGYRINRAASFLRMMIKHHEAALRMSNEYLRGDAGGEVAALAKRIVNAQTSEIRTMRKMLERSEKG